MGGGLAGGGRATGSTLLLRLLRKDARGLYCGEGVSVSIEVRMITGDALGKTRRSHEAYLRGVLLMYWVLPGERPWCFRELVVEARRTAACQWIGAVMRFGG